MLSFNDESLTQSGPKTYTWRELVKAYLAAAIAQKVGMESTARYFERLYAELSHLFHVRLPDSENVEEFQETQVVRTPVLLKKQRRLARLNADVLPMEDYNAVEVVESFSFLANWNYEVLLLRGQVQLKRMEELALLDQPYHVLISLCDTAIESLTEGFEDHFALLFGDTHQTVTSTELAKTGFDDSRPARWQEFWEEFDTQGLYLQAPAVKG